LLPKRARVNFVLEKMPTAALWFGWALLAGAAATSLLRTRTFGYLMIAALAVALFFLKKSIFFTAFALVAAFVLVLTPWGSVIAMLVVISVAAWWSAGASPDAALVLWNEHAPALAASAPAPSASAAEQGKRLEGVLGPALVIGGLLIVAAIVRGCGRRDASRRIGP
jgi:hypothetical protein